MKRKRLAKHEQSLKEQENTSSIKSFRSNITGKLQTLLNGFVSELQNISEDKRQDVAKLFSSEFKKANSTEDSPAVDSSFPSLASSSDSTKVLENFIDSAKSRISGLLTSKPENQGSDRNNLLKSLKSSAQPKTIFIDPLEIQINLKFQSLLFKAFDSKKPNYVNKKQKSTTSESIITKKDWQDLSRMLQDFNQSTNRKLHSSLTKARHTQLQNGSGSIQNCTVKESWSSRETLLSLSQRRSQNKELHKLTVNQENSSCPIDSSQSTKKNTKLLKMDFLNESTDSSGSSRNPFDEGCMLLLSDAEKCPQYIELHLSSESDIDESENIAEPSDSRVQQSNSPVQQSDSEDEVVVLGEKSKTYQEVTLEEDDDGQVHESVIEKVLEKRLKEEKEVEKTVFDCPKCGKSFRVQSLLQFHVKMHATENPSSKDCPNSSSSSEEESCSSERPRNLNHRARREKENTKISSKTSSIKKSHREKYKKKKKKESSKCSL